MRALLLGVASALLLSLTSAATAADLALNLDDCQEILERWATDPDSVPQALVDGCQEQLAAAAAREMAPAAGPASAAGTDPCVGSGAGSSVLCWGPWAGLAPAAAGNAPADPALGVVEYDPRPELADQFAPQVNTNNGGPTDPPLPLPVAGCQPGLPCGFATVVDGITSTAPSTDTTFAAFDLAADGSQFTVAPGAAGEIASVGGMAVTFTNRPDQFDNMRSQGVAGGQASRLVARVIRDQGGNITRAADVWANASTTGGPANSGFFAWGNAMSQADLDQLNGAGVTRRLTYSGVMSVDNATQALVSIDFGAQPTWSGNWTNPGYAFSAGGPVQGADFVSAADQFSQNVEGGFVQGALLGSPGSSAIAHIVDVDLQGVGNIKDVGLLDEVIP